MIHWVWGAVFLFTFLVLVSMFGISPNYAPHLYMTSTINHFSGQLQSFQLIGSQVTGPPTALVQGSRCSLDPVQSPIYLTLLCPFDCWTAMIGRDKAATSRLSCSITLD